MNKVKLTQEQAEALNIALDYCLGDADMLIQAHRRMVLESKLWEEKELAPLNDLTVETIKAALKYDYEIVKPKAKLPRAAIKSLEYLAYETGLNTDGILRLHKQNPNTWMGKGSGLNGMAYELLEQAINKGYEEAQEIEPTAGESLQLQSVDYEALIDLALATNDQAWFDELVAKSREVTA